MIQATAIHTFQLRFVKSQKMNGHKKANVKIYYFGAICSYIFIPYRLIGKSKELENML